MPQRRRPARRRRGRRPGLRVPAARRDRRLRRRSRRGAHRARRAHSRAPTGSSPAKAAAIGKRCSPRRRSSSRSMLPLATSRSRSCPGSVDAAALADLDRHFAGCFGLPNGPMALADCIARAPRAPRGAGGTARHACSWRAGMRGIILRQPPCEIIATRKMNANLYSLFERHFPEGAEQPFLVIPNGPVVHYDDLAALSARIAHALVAAGCKPGDRVAVQLDKHWHVLALYLACLRAGLVYLPLNTGYQRAELGYFFADAQPRVIVCNPDHLGVDRGARAHGATVLTLDRAVATDRARDATRVRHRRARARRPRGDPLHVGHDRPLEGRDAHAPQPRVERRSRWSRRGASRAATCCCTRCRSFTCTGCSSRCTARCCRERACCGCRSSTRARWSRCCRARP